MQLKEEGKIKELRAKYPILYHITGEEIGQIEPSKVKNEEGVVRPLLDTCNDPVVDERGNPRDAIFATASGINREFYALRDSSQDINWAMQDPVSKKRIFIFDKIRSKYWEYPLSSQDFVPIVPSKTDGNRIEGEYNEHDGEWISVSGNPIRVDKQIPKDTKEILKETEAMVFTITPEGKEFFKEHFLKDENWDMPSVKKALEKRGLKKWVANGWLKFENPTEAASIFQEHGAKEVPNFLKNLAKTR